MSASPAHAYESLGTGRMVVIYQTPADPAAFEDHYFNVHVPLAMRLPGLRRYEVNASRVIGIAGNAPYRAAVLYFDDLAAMRTAFDTPVGRECAADRRILAPDDRVQIILFEAAPA